MQVAYAGIAGNNSLSKAEYFSSFLEKKPRDCHACLSRSCFCRHIPMCVAETSTTRLLPGPALAAAVEEPLSGSRAGHRCRGTAIEGLLSTPVLVGSGEEPPSGPCWLGWDDTAVWAELETRRPASYPCCPAARCCLGTHPALKISKNQHPKLRIKLLLLKGISRKIFDLES